MPLEEASVTVCLVNRDGGEGLARALDALPPEVRAVVVDNASRDGSQHAARRRAYTELLENPVNAGFARGCNQAARHAGGELLLFLNNDAVLDAAALGALLAALAADPQAVAAGPRL
ncbi:MAG: glycosyltransferase, partial [Planctomycetes bacterium]|nr:glycosyltransferase [Planctomycetota bacterium]